MTTFKTLVLPLLAMSVIACGADGATVSPDWVMCRPVRFEPTGDLEKDLVGAWLVDFSYTDSLAVVHRLNPDGSAEVISSPHAGWSKSPINGQVTPGVWEVSEGMVTAPRIESRVTQVLPTMIQLFDHNMLRVECTGYGFDVQFEGQESVCDREQCKQQSPTAVCLEFVLPTGSSTRGCGEPKTPSDA